MDYYLLMTRDDEFLGRATVQTSVVAERGHIEGMWVDLEECQSGKAKVRQSGGMPVWQGQGSSIRGMPVCQGLSVRRNASLPRFVNQEECQSGKAKAKVCQSGGMPAWQGQGNFF
jgi:hypothetical protein